MILDASLSLVLSLVAKQLQVHHSHLPLVTALIYTLARLATVAKEAVACEIAALSEEESYSTYTPLQVRPHTLHTLHTTTGTPTHTLHTHSTLTHTPLQVYILHTHPRHEWFKIRCNALVRKAVPHNIHFLFQPLQSWIPPTHYTHTCPHTHTHYVGCPGAQPSQGEQRPGSHDESTITPPDTPSFPGQLLCPR